MQWIEAKVVFQGGNEELIVDLIADAFYSLNAKGVVVDDPWMDPGQSWAPDAVPLPEQPAVTGYLPADGQLEHRRQFLAQRLTRLAEENGFAYQIFFHTIDEEDWAQSWKAFFWPRQITSRIVVKPTWRDYRAEPGQLVIEIDPGMAFGTGTHPTTALCLEWLDGLDLRGKQVIDYGCGSGILAIAALKLGAARAVGIDHDPQALQASRENAQKNGVADRLDVRLPDAEPPAAADILVANILAGPLISLAPSLAALIKPDGEFALSGILAEQYDAVADCYRPFAHVSAPVQRDEWILIKAHKRA